MIAKELIEMLKGKEDYDIYYIPDNFEIEIDDETKTVNIVLKEDEENFDCDYDEEDIEVENYLYCFDKDNLIELAKKLNIQFDNFEELLEDDLIKEIINSEDEDTIKDICDELFDYSFDDFKVDNAWRYSDYESKDIGDWDVDDHLAAWYDHMMEK